MAKINQGILGPLIGNIGPVSGYMRNGENVIRSSTSNVNFRYTRQRIQQQEKLSVCMSFIKAFTRTGFLKKSFPRNGNGSTGYNRALSVLMNQAIAGIYPDIQLSYPKVLISQGKLPGAENAAAVADEDGNIHFSFTDNSDTGTASGSDKVIAVAYCEALQQVKFSLNAGLRKDGEAVLNANVFKGYAVETWIGFLGSDEENASDSVWTGRVEL